MIAITMEHNGKYTDLDLPCREKDLQAAMELLGAEHNRIHCMAIYDMLSPVELIFLENRIVDLDELNFLAKRLEHMMPEELPEFFAAAKAEGMRNISDLINLTYNQQCYTVIRDLTDLGAVGRKYLSAVKPHMSPQEWGATDFAAVGRQLMNSGKGVITEHGVVFKNEGMKPVMKYTGTTFPDFDYKGNSLVHLSLTYADQRESVYLPTESLALDKVVKRLGAPSLAKCEAHLLDFGVDNPKWIERFRTMLQEDGVVAANFVANAIDICDVNLDKLSAVMKYAGVDSPSDIVKLIDRLNCFTFAPSAKNYEDVGHYVMDCMAEYALHPSYAPYFDYKAFGKDFSEKYNALIVPGGIVFMDGPLTLDEILEREPEQAVQMGALEM